MELKVTAELRTVWKQTLAQLSGAARRMFMAFPPFPKGGCREGSSWERTCSLELL
jgi:hypothetical protein